MLPFLRPVSKEHTFTRDPHSQPDYSHPGAEPKREESNDSEMLAMEAMVKDFMKAFERKDVKAMAVIIKLAHDMLHEYMNQEEIK
jgi:hypothetical protein